MQRQINPSLQGHFSEQPRVQTLFYFENKKKRQKKSLNERPFFSDSKGKKIFLLCIFKVER